MIWGEKTEERNGKKRKVARGSAGEAYGDGTPAQASPRKKKTVKSDPRQKIK
jgi:hypothetical protein